MILCFFCLEKIFPTISTTDIMGQRDNCLWGLSCTLQNVEKNLGPLPLDAIALTQTPILSESQKCLQTFTKIPWDGRKYPIENHCPRANFLMKGNRKIKGTRRKSVSVGGQGVAANSMPGNKDSSCLAQTSVNTSPQYLMSLFYSHHWISN